MNNGNEDIGLDQLMLQMQPVPKNSQNILQKEHKNADYPYSAAVEAFESNNLKNTLFFLHYFTRVSLNDFYTYIPEFDETKFSNHLINFIDPSINIEILYCSLDILLNLTHYESEFAFLFSLIQRGLFNKLNYLLQNPINAHITRKIFTIFSNISFSTKENRDNLLLNLPLSFLIDPKYAHLYCLKDIFKFLTSLYYFPLNREVHYTLFNLIFPYIYNLCKADDYSNYKYFISHLYHVQNIIDEQFFEYYLLGNEIFPDMILYFSNYLSIKPKIKIMIFSLFKKFIPMKPELFKTLTSTILNYIELQATTKLAISDNELNQGYSLLMNQLFYKQNKIFQTEELQQILIILLKYENGLAPALKRQIGFITFQSIPLFPPLFSHSNLNLLLNVCNDLFISGHTDLLINTINLVINIQKNEDFFDESSNFLCHFVNENSKILDQIINDAETDHNLKEFASAILYCYNELNDA